ncbi:MAG: ATP-binding cassette domain-containing protein [Propionibacteriaceae bacterium]|nr:ATP-binding cassette domain-containing protein [Propionibacteriaceae bacterium]
MNLRDREPGRDAAVRGGGPVEVKLAHERLAMHGESDPGLAPIPVGPTVEAIDLGHEFVAGHRLFDHRSFILRTNALYAVTGPSGSGKSTLLSILAGWLTPTLGRVIRRGVDPVRWVFQNPHGVPRRSTLDHVAVGFIAQGYRRAEADRAARDLLERFSLGQAADSPFAALSGGEAQRVMLARGLASNPGLLLVDEPTAQLDRSAADEVNRTLVSLIGSNIIVVVATHDLQTRQACTHVIDLAEPSTPSPDSDRPRHGYPNEFEELGSSAEAVPPSHSDPKPTPPQGRS